MANLNNNTKIQVLISEQTELGVFNDAMYFSPDEYIALSDEKLESLKKQRVTNWVNSVKESSTMERPLPTEEELIAQKNELLSQVDEIESKIEELK